MPGDGREWGWEVLGSQWPVRGAGWAGSRSQGLPRAGSVVEGAILSLHLLVYLSGSMTIQVDSVAHESK